MALLDGNDAELLAAIAHYIAVDYASVPVAAPQ